MNYPAIVEEHSEYCEGLKEIQGTGRSYVNFCSRSKLLDLELPKDHLLVGDVHIMKSSPFIIGGAPGVGKSRAVTALAVAGALGLPWFGLKTHRKFRTMILQAENGLFRLQKEYRNLPKEIEDYVRITTPPDYGFAFDEQAFIEQLSEEIAAFKPDVFAIDPWTRHAKDDGRRDYIEAYERLLATMPKGNDCPAVGIVAHTRKPQIKERADGRALMHTIAGSFALAGIARSVFVLQSASDEPEDNQVVFTCCKNNDGEMGQPSAWERQESSFTPIVGFDWNEFRGVQESDGKIQLSHIREVLSGGSMKKSDVIKKLIELTKTAKSACYNALMIDGRFGKHLMAEKGGLLTFIE